MNEYEEFVRDDGDNHQECKRQIGVLEQQRAAEHAKYLAECERQDQQFYEIERLLKVSERLEALYREARHDYLDALSCGELETDNEFDAATEAAIKAAKEGTK